MELETNFIGTKNQTLGRCHLNETVMEKETKGGRNSGEGLAKLGGYRLFYDGFRHRTGGSVKILNQLTFSFSGKNHQYHHRHQPPAMQASPACHRHE